MKHLLTTRVAATGVRIILSLVVVFHLLVLTGVIPFDIVWGGRLKSHSQMLRFEVVSIILNLLMLVVVAAASGALQGRVNGRLVKGALWVMMALFLVNTVGNLLANTTLERLLFTPLTLLLALFCCRLAIGQGNAGAAAPDAGA
ncbi:hypothetical protein LRS06_16735 [Hymenobacter sp. J193]|uniref:hypothetical protein n=1 Tax=Hymenobacter sp. J193 TaxID=2898429 RepID=UPI0021515824|nr:hypothetical protein [Hymenobacter sp. J193]MCR5889384.1 hypothetical protein [Hymenobacter sp. J193]